MSYTIAQNTSLLTAASVLQKIISFVYFTLIARLVGIENTGQYFFALTFTAIFVVFADWGMTPVLTREAARYPNDAEKYVNTVVLSKILFGIGAYLLVVITVNLLGYSNDTKILVYLSGITMFFDNLVSAFYGFLRSQKNLIFEAVGIVAAQFLTLIIGGVALYLHWPIFSLIIAYTIPSFLTMFYAGYFVTRKFGIHYHFAFDKTSFKSFMAIALPFALAGIIGRFYSYSDSLLMSKMLPREALGLWSVPYKITFAFQFIAFSLIASVYPVFSNLYITEKNKIGPLFARSYKYLLTIVLPISGGLIALAFPIITVLYGKNYLPSVVPLQILLISLIFGFLGLINGALLNATNRQKAQTILMTFTLVVNIILNIFLLPKMGIIGAAISALISNALLWIGGYLIASKYLFLQGKEIFLAFNQTFWPAVIMAGISYLLSFKLNFIFVIPIGAAIYLSLLILTGGLTSKMIVVAFKKMSFKI